LELARPWDAIASKKRSVRAGWVWFTALTINPKLSIEFDRVVLKCLEKDPQLRYQSARELITDLRRLDPTLSGITVDAPLQMLPRRWLVPLAAGAGVCVMAVLLLLGLRLYHNDNKAVPTVRWE